MSNSSSVSVVSEDSPQKGQDHRSSPNFSTKKLTEGSQLTWTSSEKDAVFDVKEDKSLASDPTIFTGLSNGAVTDFVSKSGLYIANPENAHGAFTVTATSA